jgi:hypothetical protein
MRPGRPAARRARRSAAASSWVPANKARSETIPDDSPDSCRLMVRIRTRTMRPVPVWAVARSRGTADPVRMDWPSSPLRSTSKRTASHSTGAISHSSISRGVSPCSRSEGFVSARAKFEARTSRSCRYNTLFAACSPVRDLPHHFAPSMSTAPDDSCAF